jgi:hypothetical protein
MSWIRNAASDDPGRISQEAVLRMFLGLQDPNPLVRGTDLAPDPSIINQK